MTFDTDSRKASSQMDMEHLITVRVGDVLAIFCPFCFFCFFLADQTLAMSLLVFSLSVVPV